MDVHNSSNHGLSAEYPDQLQAQVCGKNFPIFKNSTDMLRTQREPCSLFALDISKHSLDSTFLFVGCFTKLSVARLYNGEWWNDRCIGKDLEGSGHGLRCYPGNFPGKTNESYEKPQADSAVSWPKLKPNTSLAWFRHGGQIGLQFLSLKHGPHSARRL
jgi:hypothetical protein